MRCFDRELICTLPFSMEIKLLQPHFCSTIQILFIYKSFVENMLLYLGGNIHSITRKVYVYFFSLQSIWAVNCTYLFLMITLPINPRLGGLKAWFKPNLMMVAMYYILLIYVKINKHVCNASIKVYLKCKEAIIMKGEKDETMQWFFLPKAQKAVVFHEADDCSHVMKHFVKDHFTSDARHSDLPETVWSDPWNHPWEFRQELHWNKMTQIKNLVYHAYEDSLGRAVILKSWVSILWM